MLDIADQLTAIHRSVSSEKVDGNEIVGVRLRREYDAEPADVWEAITEPERLRRWFAPVDGDFREGGNFQFEGNAGGQILRCERPKLLRVTFGGETSIVEVRLSTNEDHLTVLELEHTVPAEIAGDVAGSLYVGPGWDGALLGLSRYLRGELPEDADPVAAGSSAEAQEFAKRSAHAWADVVREDGSVPGEKLEQTLQATLQHFAPDAEQG